MKKLILSMIVFATAAAAFGQKNNDRLKPWSLGITGGINFSKTYSGDTFAQNFSGRNKTGVNIGGLVSYDINDNISVSSGLGFINKGYRIYNDTLKTNMKITRNIPGVVIPLGLTFRQQFSASRFIVEKMGVAMHYSFGHGEDTFFNGSSKKFRIVEKNVQPLYSMFYLGIGLGGNTAKGNRYEFGLTYQQPFGREMELSVSGGEFLNKNFLLNYRGGNLQATFTYHFNFGNFEKSDEYFY
jgi:opacity protein-like surface antigen